MRLIGRHNIAYSSLGSPEDNSIIQISIEERNNSRLRLMMGEDVMLNPAPVFSNDRCLAPVSARFALSHAGLPANDEAPSGPETRPFALRFARAPIVRSTIPCHRTGTAPTTAIGER